MLKKPIINTLVQVGGKIVTVFLSLVTTAILTRKLGPEIYGNYLLITSVWLLFDSAVDFGSKVIGVKEASALDSGKRNEIYIQVAWFRCLTSLFLFLVGLMVILFWSGFDGLEIEALVALMMIGFTAIAGSLEIIFQTEMKMNLKVAGDIVFPLIFIIFLWFARDNVNLVWIFGVYLLARIISLILGLNLAKKIVKKIRFVKLDKAFLKKFVRETWPMGVYMILFSGYDRAIDSILIKQMVGVRDLAFYGLAYKIYGNLIQPAYFLINSVFPLLSGKTENKRKLFWQTTGLMLLGALIVAPTVYLLAPWIISLLAGSAYLASVEVLRILLVAMVFAYIGHLVGFTLIAKGKQKLILLIGIISLIVNIGGNLLFIPKFGIVGAAWVTVATEAVAGLLMIGFLKSYS
jgi:O-antigen/teichoic acid export membrane protein